MGDQVRSSGALADVLGGEDLAWLRDRVRERLRRGRPPTGAAQLRDPTGAQRQAISRLLGRRLRPAATLRVDLDEVSSALRAAGLAHDVGEAVQLLEGAVVDERAVRLATAEQWRRVEQRLDAVVAGRPQLHDWAAKSVADGLVRRLAGDPAAGAALVDRFAAVLRRLPSPTPVPLARLASETLGDAHGLDPDRAVETLVLGAAQALVGEPSLPGAEGRRETWSRVGVLVDDLTSQVLALGLPAGGTGPLAAVLAAAGRSGEPVALTLGMLTRHGADAFGDLTGMPVRICENVTVMTAAADALGSACAPLVCVRGQPSVAGMRLLALLAGAGADLAYHGDFDWPGIGIANRVVSGVRRGGAGGAAGGAGGAVRPWRFGAADYERVAGGHGSPLTGRPVAPVWDHSLGAAMRRCGRQVEEEAVLDDLLADLGLTRTPSRT